MKVNLTIDGKNIAAEAGSMLIEAAHELDIYIPHFCYHPKLSIAANCRMCLVDVEKAAKPLPACATAVADGMVVNTRSKKADDARKGVMELLLINHPLDCPVCDQGGECQLQDLAVGYGMSKSRYDEPKRVVFEKHLGPLIATDMTRCIHCTRCVRFGKEIGGLTELGMVNRGEHSEIMTFIGGQINSELSGNMIDICPVGALTSKPFRFNSRSWELKRKPSLAAHDGWGSNVFHHVKGEQVRRTVPRQADSINECWISDRDRFSYVSIDSKDRLTAPTLFNESLSSQIEVDWNQALTEAAKRLHSVVEQYGVEAVGILAHPSMSNENLYMLNKFASVIGTRNVDFRLHQVDLSADKALCGIPWFGCKIEQMSDWRRVFIVGSRPAVELPLLAVKLRDCVNNNWGKLYSLCSFSLVNEFNMTSEILCAADKWVFELACIIKAVLLRLETNPELFQSDTADTKWKSNKDKWQNHLVDFVVTQEHFIVADGLLDNKKRWNKSAKTVLLGVEALRHRNAGQLQALANVLAYFTNSNVGVLAEGANSVGAYMNEVLPYSLQLPGESDNAKQTKPSKNGNGSGATYGLNVRRQFNKRKIKAFVLLGCEPSDFAQQATVIDGLDAAQEVISLCSYASEYDNLADILLPITLTPEESGSFISGEGKLQRYEQVVSVAHQAKPAWKVLYMLIAHYRQLQSQLHKQQPQAQQAILEDVVENSELINDLPKDCEQILAQMFNSHGNYSSYINSQLASCRGMLNFDWCGLAFDEFMQKNRQELINHNSQSNADSQSQSLCLDLGYGAYQVDAMSRRAECLQMTKHGQLHKFVAIHPNTAKSLGFKRQEEVLLVFNCADLENDNKQIQCTQKMIILLDDRVSLGVARIAENNAIWRKYSDINLYVTLISATKATENLTSISNTKIATDKSKKSSVNKELQNTAA